MWLGTTTRAQNVSYLLYAFLYYREAYKRCRNIKKWQTSTQKKTPPTTTTTKRHPLFVSMYWCTIEAFAFHFWCYNLFFFVDTVLSIVQVTGCGGRYFPIAD
jgi:hypothetical protein